VYAIMVPAAVMYAEKLVFGTTKVLSAVGQLYLGLPAHALAHGGGALLINIDDHQQLSVPGNALDIVRPLEFLATPQLWIYLVVGAGMIAGAVWLRRYRDAVA